MKMIEQNMPELCYHYKRCNEHKIEIPRGRESGEGEGRRGREDSRKGGRERERQEREEREKKYLKLIIISKDLE